MIAGGLLLPLTGCSSNAVAANIGSQSTDAQRWFVILGYRAFDTFTMAALGVVAAVYTLVILLLVLRASRAGRRVRRAPLVVAMVLLIVVLVLSVTYFVLTALLPIAFTVGPATLPFPPSQ